MTMSVQNNQGSATAAVVKAGAIGAGLGVISNYVSQKVIQKNPQKFDVATFHNLNKKLATKPKWLRNLYASYGKDLKLVKNLKNTVSTKLLLKSAMGSALFVGGAVAAWKLISSLFVQKN